MGPNCMVRAGESAREGARRGWKSTMRAVYRNTRLFGLFARSAAASAGPKKRGALTRRSPTRHRATISENARPTIRGAGTEAAGAPGGALGADRGAIGRLPHRVGRALSASGTLEPRPRRCDAARARRRLGKIEDDERHPFHPPRSERRILPRPRDVRSPRRAAAIARLAARAVRGDRAGARRGERRGREVPARVLRADAPSGEGRRDSDRTDARAVGQSCAERTRRTVTFES